MPVSNTTFVDFQTPVTASWLNNVDQNINWTPPYTGGVIQLISSKVQQTISVKDFGAVGNGIANDTVAVQAAFTYIASIGGGTLYFPAGTYLLTSQITFTFAAINQSLMIVGDGNDRTILNWSTGLGMQINYVGPTNSVHVRDLAFVTGTTNVGPALVLYQTAASITNPINIATNDISGVVFRGADGYSMTNYWNTCIEVYGVSNINFLSSMFIGPASGTPGQAVYIHGTSLLPPVVFNFTSCVFNNWNVGFNYGNYVQGVSFTSCNWGGCNYGIYAYGGLSNTQSQLSVANCQFGPGISSIMLNSSVTPINLSNNLFEINPTNTGVTLYLAGLVTVTGNCFLGLNTSSTNNGINFQTMSGIFNQGAGLITGNMFYNLNSGVNLTAGSSHVNVQSNQYIQCATAVINNGSNNTVGGGSQ